MKWKKNGFSYFIWFAYVLAVSLCITGMTEILCKKYSCPFGAGVAVSVLGCVLAGCLVYLIHCMVTRIGIPNERGRQLFAVAEGIVITGMMIAGILLRISLLDRATETAGYFETACVTEGNEIPQVAHGAVYFYLLVLRFLFFFLGNQFRAAIWLQMVLQLTASMLLYFTVRKLLGRFSAAVVLAGCLFSSLMIREALTLSPKSLYFLLFCIGFEVVAGIPYRKGKWLYPAFAGIVMGSLLYLDLTGGLLLFLGYGFAFARTDSGRDRKTRERVMMCIGESLGTLAGLALCLGIDAYLSQRPFDRILSTWLTLYQPEQFKISISLIPSVGNSYALAECVIVLSFLTIGFFSFWRNHKSDILKPWVVFSAILLAAMGFDFFTAELSAELYLMLMVFFMAGVGLEQCFVQNVQECTETGSEEMFAEENKVEKQEQNEEESKNSVFFLERPLPLPKKHQKRTLDFDLQSGENWEYDLEVPEGEDFDL